MNKNLQASCYLVFWRGFGGGFKRPAQSWKVVNGRIIIGSDFQIGDYGAMQIMFFISTIESPEIPDFYGKYPNPRKGRITEYFDDIDQVVSNNIVNVHNWLDSALAAWMIGQWQKVDVGWGYGGLPLKGDGTLSNFKFPYRGQINPDLHHIFTTVPVLAPGRTLNYAYNKDTFEIFAHIAEAKSPALGASVEGNYSTGNVVGAELNTMTAFSDNQKFEGDDEDHSAQFRSINMRRWEFWNRLLRDDAYFDVESLYPEVQ